MVLLFAGLYFSYSQSSMAALFVVAAVTLVAGDRTTACRARRDRRRLHRRGRIRDRAGARRVDPRADERPVAARGTDDRRRSRAAAARCRARRAAEGQPRARRRAERPRGEVRVTHDAAHRRRRARLVGFALYVLLLLAAIRMLALLRETLPTLALALGARLLALFTHSLAYSGFFEDPITWLTLGVGAAYLAVRARQGTGTGPRRQRDDREPSLRDQVTRREAGAVLGVLGILVAITVPELGSQAWPFQVRSGGTDPQGPFGWLVKAADQDFDIALLRVGALVAGLVVALSAAVLGAPHRSARGRRRDLRRSRRATDPAGDLPPGRPARRDRAVVPRQRLDVPDRDRRRPDPGRREPVRARLPRLRARALVPGRPAKGDDPQVALDHFAYFPGTALTATAWRLLPEPFDDYRLLVLLCTLGLFGAALLFDAPPLAARRRRRLPPTRWR